MAKLTVRLGDYNIRTSTETRHIEKKVKRVVRHKGFDARTLVRISQNSRYLHGKENLGGYLLRFVPTTKAASSAPAADAKQNKTYKGASTF